MMIGLMRRMRLVGWQRVRFRWGEDCGGLENGGRGGGEGGRRSL